MRILSTVKKSSVAIILICCTFLLICGAGLGVRAAYPRPYAQAVRESGVPPALVYAVMKAESGFDERAVSRAGAVGVMQIRPSTAQFICQKRGIEYRADALFDGNYNAILGCMYLAYLLERFPNERTAVCAYNAGEGTVRQWLANENYSADGITLDVIPFPETRGYAKKVTDFRKIYEILYG